MSLVPWRNKNALCLFQGDLNRVFDDFLGDEEGSPAVPGALWPSLNVKEDDKVVTVEAELPGMSKQDVQATVVRDVRTLSGNKSDVKKFERENYGTASASCERSPTWRRNTVAT